MVVVLQTLTKGRVYNASDAMDLESKKTYPLPYLTQALLRRVINFKYILFRIAEDDQYCSEHFTSLEQIKIR